jgi:hypothetical protein
VPATMATSAEPSTASLASIVGILGMTQISIRGRPWHASPGGGEGPRSGEDAGRPEGGVRGPDEPVVGDEGKEPPVRGVDPATTPEGCSWQPGTVTAVGPHGTSGHGGQG